MRASGALRRDRIGSSSRGAGSRHGFLSLNHPRVIRRLGDRERRWRAAGRRGVSVRRRVWTGRAPGAAGLDSAGRRRRSLALCRNRGRRRVGAGNRAASRPCDFLGRNRVQGGRGHTDRPARPDRSGRRRARTLLLAARSGRGTERILSRRRKQNDSQLSARLRRFLRGADRRRFPVFLSRRGRGNALDQPIVHSGRRSAAVLALVSGAHSLRRTAAHSRDGDPGRRRSARSAAAL
ncbi:MAG: hypothetical protein BWZ10_02524 [candidate division BRC1 bacterium ADurb.BinA364]|nr:MAG: hypothetical protein BWZ10_02524 [candidate division BRC1 bacterium ADurb.BinA364]